MGTTDRIFAFVIKFLDEHGDDRRDEGTGDAPAPLTSRMRTHQFAH
jgi:hypothetical protein